MSVIELKLQLHTGYHSALRILESEGIRVYRFPYGKRHRYCVFRDDARRMVLRHGSESARNQRLARSAAKKKGTPLWFRCPRCGEKGSQWRNGRNTKGNREVRCGHCGRCYTVGKRPPLESTCIHCEAATKQWRQQVTSAGNLTIRCGHCRKHYTVAGNPDPALRPAWSAPARTAPERCEW